MKKQKIVHLSDLHFGTVVPELCTPLYEVIESVGPDLVAISGDLTQRARKSQFEAAASFLDKIRFRKLIVPGNHDIPLWNIFRRFFNSLDDYKATITTDLEPVIRTDGMQVLGINSTSALEWKEGRISDDQIGRIRKAFGEQQSDVFKVLVMHHPLIDCVIDRDFDVVDGSQRTLEMLLEVGVDLVLTGHLHHQYACQSVHERSILVIQAGTALSHRTRGLPNSFNVLELNPNEVTLTIYEWNEKGRFEAEKMMRFEGRGSWKLAALEK